MATANKRMEILVFMIDLPHCAESGMPLPQAVSTVTHVERAAGSKLMTVTK
jgi:hypothetical protein